MLRLTAISAFAFAVATGHAFGEVSPAELEAISIPDRIETAIGTLELFDGVPTDATAARASASPDADATNPLRAMLAFWLAGQPESSAPSMTDSRRIALAGTTAWHRRISLLPSRDSGSSR
jgi:hypothetical protein